MPRTPTANFNYDQSSVTIGSWSSGTLTNTLGRLTEATTTSSGTTQTGLVYSYDAMGRPVSFWQCHPSNCNTSSIWGVKDNYNYDLAGDLTNWVHPDTTWPATFTNTVNNAQQITNVGTQWTDGYHPSSLATITYSPWGAINSLTNGCAGSGCSNAVETYTYNNRLQPWMIELGYPGGGVNTYADYCLVYNYFSSWTAPSSCPTTPTPPSSGTGNNGNVRGYFYQDGVNTGFGHTMKYTYDNVNRLTEDQTTSGPSLTQLYSYIGDLSNGQFGNMTCTSGCANMPVNLAFNVANNQINSPNYTYDLAGNLTTDASNSTYYTYQWDAEGRVWSVVNGATTIWGFTYDANGDRVAWVSGGVTYDHLFDPAGNWLGVAGSYSIAMLGIRPLSIYTSSETWFHHVNNIGSRTMMTSHYGTVLQDMVFYPFGGLWLNWGGGGLEYADLPYYDTNLNVDFPEYRVMSNNLGRWHSPDPVPGNPSNPQSWNMYAYVANNPTTSIDPLGLGPCPTTGPGGGSACSPEQAAQSNMGGIGGGGGEDGTVDGSPASAGIISGILSSGGGGVCPNNDCPLGTILPNTPWNNEHPDEQEFYQWTYPSVPTLNCSGSDPSWGSYGCAWSTLSKQFIGNGGNGFLGANDTYYVGNAWGLAALQQAGEMADGPAKAAFVGTGLAIAGPPVLAEFATSAAGDFLFGRGTGLLNSNDFLRIGWGWYGGNIIDYLPVGAEVFRIVIGSPSSPIHWHLWPF